MTVTISVMIRRSYVRSKSIAQEEISLAVPSRRLPSKLFLRINLNLHRPQHPQIVFGQLETLRVTRFFLIFPMRPQSNLQPQRQFHFEPSFAQSVDGRGDIGGLLTSCIDCRSDFCRKSPGVF